MWYPKRNSMKRREPAVIPCCCSSDYLLSEFREESPVEQFMFQEHETPHSNKKSYRKTSDIYMLFNQQRLDRMSREHLLEYFRSLPQTDTRMNALRAKLGDEQLASFVKSRFIQSKSELMAWSQYLMNSQDEMIAALAAEQSQTETEPAPTDAPPSE